MKQAIGVLFVGILMLSSSLRALATPINGAVVSEWGVFIGGNGRRL